jgi:hypothetical protein
MDFQALTPACGWSAAESWRLTLVLGHLGSEATCAGEWTICSPLGVAGWPRCSPPWKVDFTSYVMWSHLSFPVPLASAVHKFLTCQEAPGYSVLGSGFLLHSGVSVFWNILYCAAPDGTQVKGWVPAPSLFVFVCV